MKICLLSLVTFFTFSIANVCSSYAKANATFRGTVDIDMLNGCSGFIAIPDGAKTSDPAILITNGHCVEIPQSPNLIAGEVLYDVAYENDIGALLADSGELLSDYTITSTRLIYATRIKTDLAIYQLKETFGDLKARGVTALKISSRRPIVDEEVLIPSGYWKITYDCKIEQILTKLEFEGHELNHLAQYASGCSVASGTSGSPVISKKTGEVIGIHSLGTWAPSTLAIGGIGFATDLLSVRSCFSSSGQFDLFSPQCSLLKPNK